MRILFFLTILFLFSNCSSNSITNIENNLNVKLPSDYIILNDSLDTKEDLKVITDLQYSKSEIKYLIKKIRINSVFDLKKNSTGYEFSFIAETTGETILIKLDTIKNILNYREFHF